MVTALWLIIAYALRKRYLPDDASFKEKLVYYGCCVALTPLIALLFFHAIDSEGSYNQSTPCPNMDLL